MLGQVVVARRKDRLQRDQADQLAAGDAHPDLGRLFPAGVEHVVDRGDLVVHQVERDLGPAVLLDVPASALQLGEAARDTFGLAVGVADDLAARVPLQLAGLA